MLLASIIFAINFTFMNYQPASSVCLQGPISNVEIKNIGLAGYAGFFHWVILVDVANSLYKIKSAVF